MLCFFIRNGNREGAEGPENEPKGVNITHIWGDRALGGLPPRREVSAEAPRNGPPGMATQFSLQQIGGHHEAR